MTRSQQVDIERFRERIEDKLHTMANIVLEQIRSFQTALNKRDRDQLLQIIFRDREIDKIELNLDELCLEFTATRSPVAKDLRFIFAISHVTSNLERIGDCVESLSRHLASCAHLLENFPKATNVLSDMSERCISMLEQALRSLFSQDANLAQKIIPMDDAVDSLQESAYQLVVDSTRSGQIDIEDSLPFIFMANKLESIADIACAIADSTCFITSGESHKHPISLKKPSLLVRFPEGLRDVADDFLKTLNQKIGDQTQISSMSFIKDRPSLVPNESLFSLVISLEDQESNKDYYHDKKTRFKTPLLRVEFNNAKTSETQNQDSIQKAVSQITRILSLKEATKKTSTKPA